MRPPWIGVGPAPNECDLITQRTEGDVGRGPVTMVAGTTLMWPQAPNASSPQRLEEAGRALPWRLGGTQPGPHPDSELPLSAPCVGLCPSHPRTRTHWVARWLS